MEIVRLTNNGNELFQDQYGSVPYVCPPGQTILVPVDAVWLWFGNPNLVDRSTMAQYDRREEYQRVMVRNGFDKLAAEGKPIPEFPFLLEDLDGQRYWTVWEDPEGDQSVLKGVSAKGLDDVQAVANELETMKKQQALLLARLEELQTQPDAGTLDDVPEDKPTKVPVKQEA